MKKNTFKIKNHFTNLCRLALIALLVSVFTEVNAQSTLSTDKGARPAFVQQDESNGAAQISTIKVDPNSAESTAPLLIMDDASRTEGNMNAIGVSNTLNSEGSVKMSKESSEKATQKNKSKKSVNKPESK